MREGKIDVLGDEIWFDGHLVAVLAQRGVPATAMADFLGAFDPDALMAALREEFDKKCGCKHLKECPLHDPEQGTAREELVEDDRDPLLALLVKRSKNGLLRVQDATEIVSLYLDGEL